MNDIDGNWSLLSDFYTYFTAHVTSQCHKVDKGLNFPSNLDPTFTPKVAGEEVDVVEVMEAKVSVQVADNKVLLLQQWQKKPRNKINCIRKSIRLDFGLEIFLGTQIRRFKKFQSCIVTDGVPRTDRSLHSRRTPPGKICSQDSKFMSHARPGVSGGRIIPY